MHTATQFANWLWTNGYERKDDPDWYYGGILPEIIDRGWKNDSGYDFTIQELFQMFENETGLTTKSKDK